MTNELRRALVMYLMREFGDTPTEAYNHTKQDAEIGLAYTHLSEEQDDGTVIDEAHEMQATLDDNELAIIYYIDGEVVGHDVFESCEGLADFIKDSSFDDYYLRIHDFAPENYY